MRRNNAEPMAVLGRQDGIAMLTVLMLTVILTVIGIAAITTTTLDIRMAGSERVRESSVHAAEACLSSGVQIIQQALANAQVPPALTIAGANPMIANAGTLDSEIRGEFGFVGSTDNADPNAGGAPVAPNAVLTLAPYTVNMDIDRLYVTDVIGGEIGPSNKEILYRIDCYAQDLTGATPVSGRVTGVYACQLDQTCRPKS